MYSVETGMGMHCACKTMYALQALQDILDDDDDIGSMYLSRKARAKQRSQAATSQAETASKHAGDDEVLVAHAEEVCNSILICR